jgi:protein ImuB
MMPVEPRTTQHGLFLPSSPEPEKLEITLARIRGLVGAANVGAPELLDTHRP